MRGTATSMKIALEVWFVRQILVHHQLTNQRHSTNEQRVASSPPGSISMVWNEKVTLFVRSNQFYFHENRIGLPQCSNYLPISEYDFEKQSNTQCDPIGEAFNTLDGAQNVCKSSKHCQGIIKDTSNDQQNYHLCPANATTSLGIDIKTSFYKKIIIGKSISKWYIQNRLTFI